MSSQYNGEEDVRLVEDDSARKVKKRNLIITRVIYAVVALCVFGVVAAIVTVLILTYTNPVSKKVFQFDDVFNGKYTPNRYSADWAPNMNSFSRWNMVTSYNESSPKNESYTKCDINTYNVDTKQESVLVSFDDLQRNNIPCGSSFTTSPNNRYLSFMLDTVKVFRHSILGRIVVYDTVSKTSQSVNADPSKKQKVLQWCVPTTKDVPTTYPFAYVQDNNIYVSALSNSVSAINNATQVTFDGDNELVFNGVTDWIYEEEVYLGVSTMKWSADCSRLAFLTLNDTNVLPYKYEEYSPTDPYPRPQQIRIPTPGTPNPTVTVNIYNTASNLVAAVDIRTELTPSTTDPLLNDLYVYDLVWADASRLATVRVPRLQNRKDVLLTDATDSSITTYSSSVIKTDNVDTWIQYNSNVLRFVSNHEFVDILIHPDSPNKHYHVALYDINVSKSPKFLTKGEWDVTSILGSNGKEIYFEAAMSSSVNREILAVTFDGAQRELSDSTKRGVYSASFSNSATHFILNYNGPDLPHSRLYTMSDMSHVALLDNEPLAQIIRDGLQMPHATIKTINKKDGSTLNALFIYPPHFSESADVQYPVMMRVYGGPGNQLVMNSWGYMHDSLSLYWASLGYIVVTVDGPGTGARGHAFLTCTYKQLGLLEAEDQIAAAEQLKLMHFVDGNRVGIWGWSYGGYMTLMSLTSKQNDKVFKLGMAVAPVTDWRYYDSAYTERYMQWPSANVNGYTNSSVVQRVMDKEFASPLLPSKIDKTTGVVTQSYSHLLLVHGTGDDNVHPLNSYNLMTALQDAQVQFSTMFYPNKDHSIAGSETRRQLYRLLTSKVQEKLVA